MIVVCGVFVYGMSVTVIDKHSAIMARHAHEAVRLHELEQTDRPRHGKNGGR
jgi:hypothetical protein